MAENSLRVACIQMTSGADIQENLNKCSMLVREAARQGSKFVITPENTCHIRFPAIKKLESVVSQEDHIGVPFFSALARDLRVTLLIGSMAVKDVDGRLWNRSFLFAPDGALVTAYDKIHLFDVTLSNGEKYRESESMKSGKTAKTAKINDLFRIGLSVCYDLRFSYLYRKMAQNGANILCVPAAFTVPTGKAHWEVLLRARAIETGSFVMAAAQVGEHEGGRKTYGHSMIINPWGEIIAQAPDGEGIILADLDPAEVDNARTSIPALQHDRDFTLEKVGYDE